MDILKGKENDYKNYIRINSDPYSSCVIRFSERWANMMEKEIESGHCLNDIAEKLSHDADTEGITGFMYGCAINGLSSFWKYGEELRKWHNSKYNHNGDGVVNPAIISIN